MFRSKLVLASLIAVFLAGSQVQATETIGIYWNSYQDGIWGNADNWFPIEIPDNNATYDYDVIIDAETIIPTDEIGVGLLNSRTINRLDCYGQVWLESWDGWYELTLEDAYGLRNHGDLEIEEIEIIGNVTNLTEKTLWLCDMDIEGNLTNQTGAWMVIEYEVWVDELEPGPGGGELLNNGTIEIVPMSEFGVEGAFDNSGTIWMHGGECSADVQALENSGVIKGFGVLHGGQDVENYGAIIASGGSLAVVCEGSLYNSEGLLRNEPLASLQIKPHLHLESPADVNNYGSIEVNAGGGVAFDCYLVNESGGIIELRGGTLAATAIDQTADAEDFTGFGTIVSEMLLIDTDAEIELTGPTNIIGDVSLDSGATLVISAGQTLITGQTTNNGTIVLAGGTVLFQGGYSGSCYSCRCGEVCASVRRYN